MEKLNKTTIFRATILALLISLAWSLRYVWEIAPPCIMRHLFFGPLSTWVFLRLLESLLIGGLYSPKFAFTCYPLQA